MDDGYKPAYPDKIVVKFGLDQSVIDQRIIRDSGEDQQAFMRESLLSADLATVFNDDRYADRRISGQSPYVLYDRVNVEKVPNVEHRQALAVALDRAQLKQITGGDFAGDLGDGREAEPGDRLRGVGHVDRHVRAADPDAGDPEFAKQLIQESGEPMPPITFSYSQNPDADKCAAAVKASLEKAGITVKLNPIEASAYYNVVFDRTEPLS